MRYIRGLIIAVLSCSTLAYAKKVEVMVDGKSYEVTERIKSDHDVEAHERFDKKIERAYYSPTYMTMFEGEVAKEVKNTVAKPGLDEHQKKLATQGAVLGFGMAKGFSITGLDVANLAVSFMFSGVEDQAVRMVATEAHLQTTDGSITVTRWIPGKGVVDALAEAYPDLKGLLEQDCKFKEANEGEMWRGRDYYSVIRGKCKTNSARPGVMAKNADTFKAWHEAAGEGAIVMYTFGAMGRSADEMRAFGATVRKTLAKDWYVMQAETLTNQATGQPEKMYLISKDGVMKAYPLPPAPVFQ